MSKKRPGRPPEYTVEQARAVLSLRAQGRSIRAIASEIGGISKTTVNTIILRADHQT